MHNIAKTFFPILLLLFAAVVTAQNGKNNVGNAQRIWLDSEIGHQGDYQWKMIKAGKIQEALQEKASKSNKFGRFMKQYWRIIGAICISVMIPIMIGLIKKYTTTKSTSEEGETEDAE